MGKSSNRIRDTAMNLVSLTDEATGKEIFVNMTLVTSIRWVGDNLTRITFDEGNSVIIREPLGKVADQAQ
jgi:hypothetical protein